jgi:hypothetical protein
VSRIEQTLSFIVSIMQREAQGSLLNLGRCLSTGAPDWRELVRWVH